jgi:hypothetical protein
MFPQSADKNKVFYPLVSSELKPGGSIPAGAFFFLRLPVSKPAAELSCLPAACPTEVVFFVGSCERPTSQLRGKTGLASLNRFRPTPVGSQQGICTPYTNAAGFSGLGRPSETMEEKKEERMDETEDLYVAGAAAPAANSDSHLCCLFSIVCVHAQSPLRYLPHAHPHATALSSLATGGRLMRLQPRAALGTQRTAAQRTAQRTPTLHEEECRR